MGSGSNVDCIPSFKAVQSINVKIGLPNVER